MNLKIGDVVQQIAGEFKYLRVITRLGVSPNIAECAQIVTRDDKFWSASTHEYFFTDKGDMNLLVSVDEIKHDFEPVSNEVQP